MRKCKCQLEQRNGWMERGLRSPSFISSLVFFSFLTIGLPINQSIMAALERILERTYTQEEDDTVLDAVPKEEEQEADTVAEPGERVR